MRLRLPPLLADSGVLRELAWTGFVSSLGSAVQGIAFGYLAYRGTGRAIAPVLVVAAYSLPYAAVSLPAGRWGQRFDRRRIVVAANAAKVVIYAGVLALSLAGALSLALLAVTSALGGLTSAIQYPAWQGLLHALARGGRLDQANALFASLSSVAKIAGALLGGVVIDAVGANVLFAFNVLSYLPFIWAVARVPDSAARAERAPPKAVPLRQVSRIVGDRLLLRRSIVVIAVLELLVFPLIAVLPRLAADVGSSARYYGILAGAFYAGAAAVVLLLRRLKRRGASYGRIVELTTVAAGAALLVHAVAGATLKQNTALLLAALVVSIVCVGVALTTASAVLNAIAQLAAPQEIEGRILGFYALVMLTTTTVGGLVIGALGDVVSIWWVLAVAGALVVAYGLALHRLGGFAVFDDLDYGAEDDAAVRHAQETRTALAGATIPSTALPATAPERSRGAGSRSSPRRSG